MPDEQLSLEQSIWLVPDMHFESAVHHPQPRLLTQVASSVMPVHVGQQVPLDTKVPVHEASPFATHRSPQYEQTDSTVHAPQLSKLWQ